MTSENKLLLGADQLLQDSFKLAAAVYDSGYKPTFIVGVWRGGAPVGIAIQEFLQVLGCPSDHIAVRTSAYASGIDNLKREVQVHNLGYLIERVGPADRLLLVDDVFDTGRSMQALITELHARLQSPVQIRVACPWFKPERNQTTLQPDYFLHETRRWLVFPHEIDGLSSTELHAKNPELAEMLAARR